VYIANSDAEDSEMHKVLWVYSFGGVLSRLINTDQIAFIKIA